MTAIINNGIFNLVKQSVFEFCSNGHLFPKLILTEGDLEARLFAALINNDQFPHEDIHIHSQLNYLKESGHLGYKPDIILVDKNGYDVDPNGGLYDRKGYTIWGSSIALELKLLRPKRDNGFTELVIEDLEKLKKIKDTHYGSDQNEVFFGASSVYCLQKLDDPEVSKLIASSEELQIPLWLFNKSSCEQGCGEEC